MNNEYYTGLNNHGNTCFFNSALQSLMRCSVFINFISELDIDNEYINIFKEIIIEYKKNSGKSISPIKLVKYYEKLNTNYSLGKQDDADEVITYLIGEIDDVIKKYIKEGKLENCVIKGDITMDKMMDYLFGVIIVTITKCLKCKNQTTYNVKEFKLSVALKDSDNLEEILDNYSQIENLNGDNRFYCNTCKKNVDAIKCDKILKTPKYLHIQLKRFENNGRRFSKINKNIKININQNICDNEYKLRGCVHHMGTYHGGHYIYNYNKNKNNNFNNWLCLNDGSISFTDITNTINDGYIYLYVK
jgi:ubiquitin C-terminal hydrolase